MAAATFTIAAPGVYYSADNPLLREDPVGIGSPDTAIISSLSIDEGDGYVLGWQDGVYGPAVACELTITGGTELTGLVIGMLGGSGWYGGVSGPRDPADFDFKTGLFLRGSGGLYRANYPDPLALEAATPALEVGDVISLRSHMRQYESGALTLNGVEYAFSDGVGLEFAVLRGGAFSEPAQDFWTGFINSHEVP